MESELSPLAPRHDVVCMGVRLAGLAVDFAVFFMVLTQNILHINTLCDGNK